MSTFAISAVFEALVAPPRVDPTSNVVPAPPSDVVGASDGLCAFTADMVRVTQVQRPRDASRQRHPAFVAWLHRETGPAGDLERTGFGDDPRAA